MAKFYKVKKKKLEKIDLENYSDYMKKLDDKWNQIFEENNKEFENKTKNMSEKELQNYLRELDKEFFKEQALFDYNNCDNEDDLIRH